MQTRDPLSRSTNAAPKQGDQVVVKMWVVETVGDMCRIEPLDGVGAAWIPTAYLLRDPGSLAPLEPRFNPVFDCPTKTLREMIDQPKQYPWPNRLAAGRALVDRGESDEWAQEAYVALSCDDVADLRVVGVQGMALDRSVNGLASIVDALGAEVSQARPSSHVALTALQAIDTTYPVTLWRDSEGDVRGVLAVWERCEHLQIRELATRLLARLTEPRERDGESNPSTGAPTGIDHV